MTLQVGRPSAELCIGRDELCRQLVEDAIRNGAVLLYGGRQAGKTSVLLKLRTDLVAAARKQDTSPLLVPVYVDLLKLGVDSDPSDFFRMLVASAFNACETVLGERSANMTQQSVPVGLFTLDHVISHLEEMLKSLQRSDARFVVLLDESKRILGPRFPRGVQDNLFSLMFGEHQISGRVSLVFTGAQELYAFSIDETSPIGSRAATITLGNLDEEAVIALAQAIATWSEDERGRIASSIFRLTGGQAGLTVRLLAEPGSIPSLDNEASMGAFRGRTSGLLQIWAASFTPEARCVENLLIRSGHLRYDQIAASLSDCGFDRYRTDRVCDEFVFSGVAIRTKDGLKVVNQIYATFVLAYLGDQTGSAEEHDAWARIERAELALRTLIRTAYEKRWADQADARIAAILGQKSMETINASRAKGAKSYRFTAHDADSDILHYAYFGQLTQLMLTNVAWDMFRDKFRDKRELEDIAKDVMPVRNDSAHFRSVPDRERLRCALRCDDLLHLITK